MAISEIYNSLIFGDVNSADYGVYISGEGAFNAPSRDVELVSVPGRNGDIALDNGRYNNITVTYPAGIYGDDEEGFREKLSEFRNALVSQKGYKRLSDTYHPDEFRLGLFSDGLDVSTVQYNTAGQFDIVFNCKPQRFLVSGEEPTEVTSGDVLSNPTVFESSPLIKLWGFGNLNFNGFDIDLQDAQLGEVIVKEAGSQAFLPGGWASQFKIDPSALNLGDTFTMELEVDAGVLPANSRKFASTAWPTVVSNSMTGMSVVIDTSQYTSNSTPCYVKSFFPPLQLTYGQSETLINDTVWNYQLTNASLSSNYVYRQRIVYDGNNRISVNLLLRDNSSRPDSRVAFITKQCFLLYADIIGISSKSILGDPTTIDTETGEAYFMDGDSYVSLNKDIALGSELPKLSPGDNEVTFDNTFTKIEIAPRWWRL